MINRKETKKVMIGDVGVGGNEPVRVQSMTNTDTRDIEETVTQIKRLEKVGCEIARVAVPDMKAAEAIAEIKKQIKIPLVADIHFSADLALEAIRQGVDKIRINPGNVKPIERIKEVVIACKEKKIPIRVGVNAGSLEEDILQQYGNVATAKGMVQSALRHITILEELGFEDILISLKASDIERTIEAYKELSEKVDYPLHVGVTEAGTKFRGTVMSSIGIGALLYAGIGDTIRVSLTDDPVEEIPVAWEILSALDLRHRKPTVTSCPTCGRTEIDLLKLTKEVEALVENFPEKLHIAVMGCIVNGPGEAKEADIAVIGGKGVGLICRKGEIIKKVDEKDLLTEFKKELDKELKSDLSKNLK